MKPDQATSNSTAAPFEADNNDLVEEVMTGLTDDLKSIAPKYFYDQTGAALFDQITELDEYYITRVEEQIYRDHKLAICAAIGNGVNIVEPGAGSCEKIRWLLPELQPACYVPMDISAEHLAASAARLRAEYPELTVSEQVCDHTQGLALEQQQYPDSDAPLVFFYPGSSIGNFEPAEAAAFMGEMRAIMRKDGRAARGGLLIGVDTKKSTEVLHAAYNDSDGVTAQFNLNVLNHLNDLLDGDINVDNFEHVARFNEADGRIEMYLQSTCEQSASLAGEQLEFSAGELIHTENSYKYSPDEFIELAEQAGFSYNTAWQDERRWFSVLHFVLQ